MSTERALAAEMLTRCAYCQCEGPVARLGEHQRIDHPELFWGEPYTASAAPLHVELPGRFRHRLEKLAAQSGRSLSQIVSSVLDAQGLGRRDRPEGP
jgi:hypothetical protein